MRLAAARHHFEAIAGRVAVEWQVFGPDRHRRKGDRRQFRRLRIARDNAVWGSAFNRLDMHGEYDSSTGTCVFWEVMTPAS